MAARCAGNFVRYNTFVSWEGRHDHAPSDSRSHSIEETMKVQTVIQMSVADNAAAALSTMLLFYGRYVPMEEMRIACPASRNGTPSSIIAEAASSYGLESEVKKLDFQELKSLQFPVMVLWRRRYYTILKGFRKGLAELSDPSKGEYEMTEEKFESLYSGTVISFAPGPDFQKGGKPETLRELLTKRLEGMKSALFKIFVLNVAAVVLNLIYLNGVKKLLDENAMAGLEQQAIWGLILLESLLLLLYTCVAMNKTLRVRETSRRAAASSGSKLFKHLFKMPMEFFDQASAGELMQRMDNNSYLDRSIILTLVPRVIDVVMAAVYLFMMFSYNRVVAAACLLVEVVYLICMRAQRNAIALRSRSMVTSSGAMSSTVLNGIGTIDTIKMGGTERIFFSMWKSSQTDYQDNSRTGNALNAVTSIISGVHSVFSSAALLFVGAYYMMRGEFDAASMATMQMIVGRVGNSLSNCMNTMNALQTMRTNIERVEDINNRATVLEVPLPEGSDPDKLRGDLVLDHVGYRYNPGDPLAVSDVSLTIHPGEVFAIVGKTGCGKSTLLKLIADLYTPAEGTITYGGKTRAEVPDVVFRSSVVAVDQEVMIFEDTVRANLKMWDDTIENYAMVLAARDAQIHDRIIRERDGYDTVVRENGKNYSGGELQRLELARALETEPTFLLLDEFTSALDALTEEKVMEAIRDVNVTTVIVAHRLSTIRDADQIIVMDKGRIVARGTHDELMSQGGLYHDLVATG